MKRAIWVCWLAGCSSPIETGPRVFVGVLMDQHGETLSDVTIESVESRDQTNQNGEFTVGWRRPSRFCLLYTSPSPRDRTRTRMPSSA